jgi:hypothetical protein
MNVTLSLDDKLVKEVRKVAVEQDTTRTGLVRDYLNSSRKTTPLTVADAAIGKGWSGASSWGDWPSSSVSVLRDSEKDLPTIRVGRCRLITEKALHEWLERKGRSLS